MFSYQKIDNKINIIDYLSKNIFLIEKYQKKISKQSINGYLVDLNEIRSKIAEIIACLNALLTILNDIFKSLLMIYLKAKVNYPIYVLNIFLKIFIDNKMKIFHYYTVCCSIVL